MKVGTRVRDMQGLESLPGTVVARYVGNKTAMSGMVQVQWDEDSGLTWEEPARLVVEPSEEVK